MRKLNLFIKRSIDILGSLAGGILISPILLLIALSIKISSRGPIFFKQERLGKNGEVFRIIKFRTMIVNAEKVGSGLIISTESDSRITKIGKILRALSLDELPQLWNVLIGDMSLVGPRPPVTYHPYKYVEYSDFQRIRFNMKPGLTGLAQVTVRNSVPWTERIIIDIQYVNEFNILLDIKILINTIRKLLKSESIYINDKSKVNSFTNIK